MEGYYPKSKRTCIRQLGNEAVTPEQKHIANTTTELAGAVAITETASIMTDIMARTLEGADHS